MTATSGTGTRGTFDSRAVRRRRRWHARRVRDLGEGRLAHQRRQDPHPDEAVISTVSKLPHMAESPWRCSQCGTINEPVANSCRTCGRWPSLFDLQDSVVEDDEYALPQRDAGRAAGRTSPTCSSRRRCRRDVRAGAGRARGRGCPRERRPSRRARVARGGPLRSSRSPSLVYFAISFFFSDRDVPAVPRSRARRRALRSRARRLRRGLRGRGTDRRGAGLEPRPERCERWYRRSGVRSTRRSSSAARGTHQSPVDLAEATPADLPDLEFDYPPTPLVVKNTGHVIEAAVPDRAI